MRYAYPPAVVCTLLLCLRLFLDIAFSCIPAPLPLFSSLWHCLALAMPAALLCLPSVRRLCSRDAAYSLRYTKGTASEKRASLPADVTVAVFLFALFGLGVLALSQVMGIAVEGAGYTVDVGEIPLWEGLLCYVILPPVGEELFYRFAVLGCFSANAPVGGVLLSSLLFALSHGGLWQLPYTLFAGILLGITALRFKSILPGMVFHFVNNAVSFTLSLLPRGQATLGMWIYGGILLALGIVSGICLLRLRKKGEGLLCPPIAPTVTTASAFARNVLLSPLSVYILAAILLKLSL